MTAPVHAIRLNHLGEPDHRGRLFVDPSTAAITDLSGVRLLSCAVDTVRQHYHGRPSAAVVELFGGQLPASGLVQLGGFTWHAGRVGRDSGYQWKLQNADLGVIALVKNHSVKVDTVGPHLKIEVSPHAIRPRLPSELQSLLDELAGVLLDDCTPNQCAVHIALDLQGWTPPADLVARMHCRSRHVRVFSGVERIEYDESAAVYGRGKSFLFGSAGGLQLAIYDKTSQALATDKLDYWRSEWSRCDNPLDAEDPLNYQPALPVWRVELRFHHSVVDQFAQGSADIRTGAVIGTRTYAELAGHLEGLWRYGLQAFRYLVRPGCYDALWSLMTHDVTVSTGALLCDGVKYRRHYKSGTGFTGKNVELFMGNLVSLGARQSIGAGKLFDQLQQWDCWPTIREHYHGKGMTDRDIYRWLCDKLSERVIRWGRAV